MTDIKFKLNSKKLGFNLPTLSVIFSLVLALFFLFYDQSRYSFEENSSVADAVIIISLLLSVGCFIFKSKDFSIDNDTLIALIFAIGFALRLGYALRYGYNINQHDVESLNSSGHLSYIYHIFEHNSLPDSNAWQFSHPPLHHIISAIILKISDAFGFSLDRGFENIQLLSVFYSTMTMFVGYKILKFCSVNGLSLVFCSMLLSFHPLFSIFAGSINNDTLLVLLTMCAVLFLLKWYKCPSLKFAALCGLFSGLAMMTKVSAALVAVVAAVSVLIRFFKTRDLTVLELVLHAIVFLLIFLPLGLWHPVRNYILFSQPFGYVAPIPITSSLYTGDVSIIDRIILPFSRDNFDIYVQVWEEYNLWFYILRNSLFGEYNFGNLGFAAVSVIFNAVLIILALIGMIALIVKRTLKQLCTEPLLILYFVQLGFFVYFNISYPFGCTMDFRYAVPTLFCSICFLGTLQDSLSLSDKTSATIQLQFLRFSIISFSVCSIIVMI